MTIENIILSIIGMLLVFLLGMLNAEIKRAMSKETFDEYKEQTEKRLHRGSDHFDKIENKADVNGNRITQVEAILEERTKKK